MDTGVLCDFFLVGLKLDVGTKIREVSVTNPSWSFRASVAIIWLSGLSLGTVE